MLKAQFLFVYNDFSNPEMEHSQVNFIEFSTSLCGAQFFSTSKSVKSVACQI